MNRLLDRPIAYHRVFAEKMGVCGAVFLSQLFYWSFRTKDEEGWIYKTAEEWKEETGLTRYELETARKKAKELGIVEERLKGVPATLHYRIKRESFYRTFGLCDEQQTSLLETSKLYNREYYRD